MRRESSVGVASVVLSAGAAFPSIERSIEVAQPIVTEAEEICVRNVTYRAYLARRRSPGAPVPQSE